MQSYCTDIIMYAYNNEQAQNTTKFPVLHPNLNQLLRTLFKSVSVFLQS